MKRDKYGNYVNDEGVIIKINDDSSGRTYIDFYDNDVDQNHSAVHIRYDSSTGKYNSGYHNETKTKKDSSSGGCYLTTACMRHMQENFDDCCEELMMLRWFRDSFVSKADVEHYYQTAPIVVNAINAIEDNDAIYRYLYENVVNACVQAIKLGNYDFAYHRYKDSVLVLEEQFARPVLEERLVRVLKFKNR